MPLPPWAASTRHRGALLAAVAVFVLATSVVAFDVVERHDDDLAVTPGTPRSTAPAVASTTSTTTTTTAPPPSTATTSSTSAPPVAPTTAAVPATVPEAFAAQAATGRPFSLAPYGGLGAWLDVFDWSVTYDRTPEDPPAVGLADLDRMAELGVRTVYFQPARWDGPLGLVEPELARAIVDRAHARGMAVVAWFLPTMEDPAADRARIDAALTLPVDGLGIDIESVRLPDEAERNRRIVALSAELRADHPGEVLSAIVLPPVVTEVYGTYWGGFPWAELAPYYDIWQPMGYWTMRPVQSGWRDAYTYTEANIRLLREATGRPDAIVHPVGGIGCCEGPTAPTTPADIEGMLRAAAEAGSPGASIYDYVTTGDELWPALQGANALAG